MLAGTQLGNYKRFLVISSLVLQSIHFPPFKFDSVGSMTGRASGLSNVCVPAVSRLTGLKVYWLNESQKKHRVNKYNVESYHSVQNCAI